MSSETTREAEASVLGQLVLMQSVLGGLPDDASIFAFVTRGVSFVPGIVAARHLPENAGQETSESGEVVYPLVGTSATWGSLALTIDQSEAFAPYEPYLRNFVVMLVLVLEERAQRQANTRHSENLEERVRERTAQLTAEIADRRAVEEELRRSRDMLARTLNAVPQGIFWKDVRGVYRGCNEAFAREAGFSATTDVIGKTDAELPWRPEDCAQYREDDRQVAELRLPKVRVLERLRRLDGSLRWVETTKVPLLDADGRVYAVLGVLDDVTDKRRADQDRESLRNQLAQAQKMDSVGRLAGGVAHDFNNMLQAILGNAGMALAEPYLPASSREHLEEILRAAERSASLTQQLLAFARKQSVAPQVLDLNTTVAAMLKMLQRLIGENIRLVWTPGEGLGPIRIDPVQIDQVLANLVVNSRDAITGSGCIEIVTGTGVVRSGRVEPGLELTPGEYVTLTVTDSGCGMSPETRAHLFEPFFTTKPAGKGTGLGLATVYGIIKQNQGAVTVQSEIGRGSSFTVWLPRTEVAPQAAPVKPTSRPLRGTETLLLVEDEEQILTLAQRILKQQGYNVIGASAPDMAIRLVEQHAGPIQLIITDVIMPGMNGRDLLHRISALKPGIRCLFISGYTADVLAKGGYPESGVEFQQKPFTATELVERVRHVLDAPAKNAS